MVLDPSTFLSICISSSSRLSNVIVVTPSEETAREIIAIGEEANIDISLVDNTDDFLVKANNSVMPSLVDIIKEVEEEEKRTRQAMRLEKNEGWYRRFDKSSVFKRR
jgi:hypothetical protein